MQNCILFGDLYITYKTLVKWMEIIMISTNIMFSKRCFHSTKRAIYFSFYHFVLCTHIHTKNLDFNRLKSWHRHIIIEYTLSRSVRQAARDYNITKKYDMRVDVNDPIYIKRVGKLKHVPWRCYAFVRSQIADAAWHFLITPRYKARLKWRSITQNG